MPVEKLDLMRRAKEYMECLAGGADPVSGQPLSRADPMGSERMQRCFAFVAKILGEVIAERESPAPTRCPAGKAAEPAGQEDVPPRKRQRGARSERIPFTITAEALETVPVTEQPASISEMIRRLSAAQGTEEKTDLTARLLFTGFHKMGFLDAPDSASQRMPTLAGEEMGFIRLRRTNSAGQVYMVNMLLEEGQRFLLDHLEEILQCGRQAVQAQKALEAQEKAKAAKEKADAMLREAEEKLESAVR